jgi:hypothetical protein
VDRVGGETDGAPRQDAPRRNARARGVTRRGGRRAGVDRTPTRPCVAPVAPGRGVRRVGGRRRGRIDTVAAERSRLSKGSVGSGVGSRPGERRARAGRSRIRSPPRCAPHVATRSSRVFREARPRGSRTARTSTRRTRRGFPPSSRLFATSAAAAPSPSRTFSRSVWKHTRRIQPPGTTSRRSGAYCWRRPRSSRVNERPRSSRL